MDRDETLEARLADAERERDTWIEREYAARSRAADMLDERDAAIERAEKAEAELVLAEVKVENICDDNDIAERERDEARERIKELEYLVRGNHKGWQAADLELGEARAEAAAYHAALSRALDEYMGRGDEPVSLADLPSGLMRDPSPAVARMLAAVEVAEAYLEWNETDCGKHIDESKDECPACMKNDALYTRVNDALCHFRELGGE